MGFFKNLGDAVSTMTGINGGNGGGFAKFISNIAPAIPIVGGIASNVLAGINNRKARLYNSPAEQIKRMREAGLPLGAGSNISAGGGVSTPVQDLGLSGLNDNLGKSIIRNIDRKKLQIHQEELRSAKYAADIAQGNAKNQLNPRGMFENTNQGTITAQAIASQAAAIKNAETVNKFMPLEKWQGLSKGAKEIDMITANIRNSLTANQIQLQDLAIKKILSKYQEKMSLAELQSLIKGNAIKDLQKEGMATDNAIKKIAYTIEWQTQVARITMAKNAALASGNNLEAQRLSLLLTNASLPSTQAYYEIRRGLDKATLEKPNLPNTLLYLGMFQPTTSNYNFGQLMPSIPSGGNTYNTNNYIPK